MTLCDCSLMTKKKRKYTPQVWRAGVFIRKPIKMLHSRPLFVTIVLFTVFGILSCTVLIWQEQGHISGLGCSMVIRFLYVMIGILWNAVFPTIGLTKITLIVMQKWHMDQWICELKLCPLLWKFRKKLHLFFFFPSIFK